MKRICDVVITSGALVVVLPLVALIALLVRIGSPGPIFFRQARVGRFGTDFVLNKFRTMTSRPGAEKGSFEPGDSMRVTRVGKLLRTTKLDELPQLFNVLTGDMSLVGPRPEVRKWVEVYPERWEIAHTVRPGITDPAAILYRNEEQILASVDDPERLYREYILPRKLGLYEEYVKTRTFWGDLKIIGRTLVAVVACVPRVPCTEAVETKRGLLSLGELRESEGK